jgi:hypothetical protein
MFYNIRFFGFIDELTLVQVLFLSRTIQQLKAQVEGIKQERSKVSG